MILIDQCLKDIKIKVFYNPDKYTHDIEFFDVENDLVIEGGYESKKDSLRLVKMIKMKLALQKFIRLNNIECDLEKLINHNLYDYLFQNKLVNDESKNFKFTVRKTLLIVVEKLFSGFTSLDAAILIENPKKLVNHFLPYPPAGCKWINVLDKQKIKLIEDVDHHFDLRCYDEIEEWIELFQKLKLKTSDGYEYYLYETNGLLWLVCPAKMSYDEYNDFFGEPLYS